MSSPEHRGGPPDPEPQRSHGADPVPYVRAAQFATEQAAAAAYFAAQEVVYAATSDCDPSVYRFLLAQVSYVAVLGEPPPSTIDATLTDILAAGESATLPRGVLIALVHRRQQASRLGPWGGRPSPSGPATRVMARALAALWSENHRNYQL